MVPFQRHKKDPKRKYRSRSLKLHSRVRPASDSRGRRRSFGRRGLRLGPTNRQQCSFSSSQISLRIFVTDKCHQGNFDGCFETDFGARSRRRNRPQWRGCNRKQCLRSLTSLASLLKLLPTCQKQFDRFRLDRLSPSARCSLAFAAGRVFPLLVQYLGHRQVCLTHRSHFAARTEKLRCVVAERYRPTLENCLRAELHFSKNDA
jgi:hypothetical protein